MNWLKRKIRNWLFSDEINELKTLWHTLSKLESHTKQIDSNVQRIERCFNVGIDVQPIEGRHWAIICARQPDERSIIRFVDLSRRHPKEIEEFMNYFTPDRANKHWDIPHGYLLK